MGTKAIGNAAIKYYIDGVSIEEAREIFKKENNYDNTKTRSSNLLEKNTNNI